MRYRTDWTGLQHEFPYERVGASFIQVALDRRGLGTIRRRRMENEDVRDTRWLLDFGHPGAETSDKREEW
jgi:hypothetical protein